MGSRWWSENPLSMLLPPAPPRQLQRLIIHVTSRLWTKSGKSLANNLIGFIMNRGRLPQHRLQFLGRMLFVALAAALRNITRLLEDASALSRDDCWLFALCAPSSLWDRNLTMRSLCWAFFLPYPGNILDSWIVHSWVAAVIASFVFGASPVLVFPLK